MVYFFGSTGGGLWKTDDGGWSWQNTSDGFFQSGSIGAIAIAPSDHNVMYVGMGHAWCIELNPDHQYYYL